LAAEKWREFGQLLERDVPMLIEEVEGLLQQGAYREHIRADLGGVFLTCAIGIHEDLLHVQDCGVKSSSGQNDSPTPRWP
jgi:hypothetical protein